MPLDAELLELLACPKCKGPLVHDESDGTLNCDACRLRYRIEDGIPILLIDEAESF